MDSFLYGDQSQTASLPDDLFLPGRRCRTRSGQAAFHHKNTEHGFPPNCYGSRQDQTQVQAGSLLLSSWKGRNFPPGDPGRFLSGSIPGCRRHMPVFCNHHITFFFILRYISLFFQNLVSLTGYSTVPHESRLFFRGFYREKNGLYGIQQRVSALESLNAE